MTNRLHIVMSVYNKTLWASATFTIDDRVTAAHSKRSSSNTDALHRLLDGFGDRTHSGPAGGDRRHSAQHLQTFRECTRVAVYVSVKFGENHQTLNITSFE